jgi:hypothetical protein
MQYINIAVVILVVTFNFLEDDLLGFLPILQGSYTGFTPRWYARVGNTLCVTLLINIVSPHISKVAVPGVKLLLRLFDRGCHLSYLATREELNQTGKNVRTRKLTQTDLNALYTGSQIPSHYIYAQNFTYLWCVLSYSGGMPILYPIGALFFFILYWILKFMLLKYYSRTTSFTEELPLFSTKFMIVGLVLHGIAFVFMVSNTALLPLENRTA